MTTPEPTSTPAPTPSSTPEPSPTPVWERTGWEIVWHDEFDGTELNRENWTFDIGGFANEGLWPLCHQVDVRPQFRRIVCAVDESLAAAGALQLALSLAQQSGGR